MRLILLLLMSVWLPQHVWSSTDCVPVESSEKAIKLFNDGQSSDAVAHALLALDGKPFSNRVVEILEFSVTDQPWRVNLFWARLQIMGAFLACLLALLACCSYLMEKYVAVRRLTMSTLASLFLYSFGWYYTGMQDRALTSKAVRLRVLPSPEANTVGVVNGLRLGSINERRDNYLLVDIGEYQGWVAQDHVIQLDQLDSCETHDNQS